MKALCLNGYGRNLRKNIEFLDIEVKKTGPTDLLIEIRAAGLNPVDYKLIHGVARIIYRPKRPYPLGFDLSGVVVGKGEEVSDFEIGDEVYSKVTWEQMGTIASHLVVRSDMVALKPSNISFEEAAGIPLVGTTVFDSFRIGKVKKGTRILIHAGSGGIGTFAIQYAKYLGAYVYTTTSTENVEWVKALGADCVIDYKTEDYRTIVKDIDVVYDTLGRKYLREAISVVKKGGAIISIAGHFDNETLEELGLSKFIMPFNSIKGSVLMYRMRRKNIFYKYVFSKANQELLNEITALIEQGEIKPINDLVFDFDQVIEALIYVKNGRSKGKVVVKIK